MLERFALRHDLRSALARSELFLHYLPQLRISGEVFGFESLLRWQHPKLGLISSDVFIPLAEQNGTIVDIGEWALRQSCKEAATSAVPLPIAVKRSPVQFRFGDLAGLVHSILFETGLAPSRLELGITGGVLTETQEWKRSLSLHPSSSFIAG